MGKFKSRIYERILYPIYQSKRSPVFGYKSINTLNHLKKSQWWSSDMIKAYQNEKLGTLIKYIYHNIAYYRDVMKSKGIEPQDIRNIDDLKYFPVLTKEVIRTNFHEITSKNINKKTSVKISTSGTTGKPLTFFRDHNSLLWMEAARLRGWSWAQYQVGSSVLQSSSTCIPTILGKIRLKFINTREFLGFSKEDEIIRYFKENKNLSSFCLTGLPSNLYRIAKILQKNDVNGLHFNVIFSTAEMLYDHQREYFERTFNCQVYDYYGCNEIGSMAYECEHKNKHITNEHVILEVTDSEGNSIVGNPGEVTITDLDNYAMPFIRYKLGDVGTLSNEICSCGRGLSILKHVDGRTQDFLRTLDGNYVPSIFFPSRFRSFKGIEQYQIIQNDINKITLKIVKNQYFSTHELEGMIRVIKEMIGGAIQINIEECTDMLFTGRGKSRLVISTLDKNF